MTIRIKYEFASALHSSESSMLDHIAATYITADGANSPRTVAEALATMTDAELARECIEGFELDESDDRCDDYDKTAGMLHMEFNGYSIGDLAAAMGRFREEAASSTT